MAITNFIAIYSDLSSRLTQSSLELRHERKITQVNLNNKVAGGLKNNLKGMAGIFFAPHPLYCQQK